MTICYSFILIISAISVGSALRTMTPRYNRQQALQYRKISNGKASTFDPFSNVGYNLESKPLSPSTGLQPIYSDLSKGDLIGEDAATFNLNEQSLKEWGTFFVAVGGIISFLFYVWIYQDGPLLGDQFKTLMEGLAGGDSTLTITYMLGFFAVAHSGLASLRPAAEKIVGARVWRYIFALVSLPLSLSSIVYFINHRYDGIQLWDLRLEPGMHDFVWWTSLVSFLFLYPSTFNLLEVR